MFTKLINSIKDSVNRTSNQPEKDSTKDDKLRRASASDAVVHDTMLSHHPNSHSTSILEELHKASTMSDPIGIKDSSHKQRRRSNTTFGISTIECDDYVQKDLISSSWS
ncbi:hypothetical protein BDB01DRAFT_846028 [Pilobolus umbonatus]|nr:hypothetical protein BDB01DRAFT_846028 [Pilobolus umbonatus]